MDFASAVGESSHHRKGDHQQNTQPQVAPPFGPAAVRVDVDVRHATSPARDSIGNEYCRRCNGPALEPEHPVEPGERDQQAAQQAGQRENKIGDSHG
jgi:hypothetical protein